MSNNFFMRKNFVDLYKKASLLFLFISCVNTSCVTNHPTNINAQCNQEHPNGCRSIGSHRKKTETPFSPTYNVKEQEDAYKIAHRIYKSSPPPSSGLYQYHGLCFVVTVIEKKQIKNQRFLEGQAMLNTHRLLRKNFQGLPEKYNIQHKILENGINFKTGDYRYVFVCQLQDIYKQLQRK